eukprot:m.135849 g.135849  ORF g.135849 m.135849 type:complete len:286 (-) comp10253_c0_seq1:1505-2362(-)
MMNERMDEGEWKRMLGFGDIPSEGNGRVYIPRESDVFDISVTPTNCVLVQLDEDFFTHEQFETALFAKAEEVAPLRNIIISEDEWMVKFVYENAEAGAEARLQMHSMKFGSKSYETNFGKAVILSTHTHHHHLQVPEPTRQFLISPPASPPIGWEPAPEIPPLITDAILLDRLAKPGVPHEIHKGIGSHPSIFVINEELPTSSTSSPSMSPTIVTPRPVIEFTKESQDPQHIMPEPQQYQQQYQEGRQTTPRLSILSENVDEDDEDDDFIPNRTLDIPKTMRPPR